MPKQLLETLKLSEIFMNTRDQDIEQYFYAGYLICKYDIILADDLKPVLEILDRLNKLHITTKQKNTILQRVSGHESENKSLEEMEKNIFEYVDEVVPHLELALKLEKTRKQSLTLTENENTKTQRNSKEENLIETECPVCLTTIAAGDLTTLSCWHSFHKECAENSFKVRIDGSLFPLICPFDECRNQISNKEIAEILSKEYQQKHETFSFKKYVEENYETMCWCPTIGCQYVFCFEAGQMTFTCPICSKFYCLKCRSEYHIGMSCKEYNRSKDIPEDDEKFYQFAEGARYKQCPKCKFWVEKSEGCHHMICRCQFEFCYICGEDYHNCGCNAEEQAQRAGLALQVAAQQLRLISEGLRNHQLELERIQRAEQIEDRQVRPIIEPIDHSLPLLVIQKPQQKQQLSTLFSQRLFQTNNKNIPSTSIGSDQYLPRLQFQHRTERFNESTSLYKPFHQSPPLRKTFKTVNLKQTNVPSNQSMKSSRYLYKKYQHSLEKPKVLERPMYVIPKLTFGDIERKKSQTKY